MKIEDHWCIKDKCTHGTLNGSLALGQLLIDSFNKGYSSGSKESKQDYVESLADHWEDVGNYPKVRLVKGRMAYIVEEAYEAATEDFGDPMEGIRITNLGKLSEEIIARLLGDLTNAKNS